MDHSNKATSVVIAGLVALAIGGGVGYGIGNNKMDMDHKTSTTQSAQAENRADGVTVGGAVMVSDKDIVDNAAQAKNVTTLVAAVKAADLVDTLKGAGPFTVFGPDNDAFAKLPAGTVDTLLMPENKAMLAKILTLHVVPGTYTSADLRVMAQKGETLTSVEGEMLTPVMVDNKLTIKDPKGGSVNVKTADVISSNGVTHVIDTVLMPAN